MSGLTCQIRADRLEIKYRGMRTRHGPSRELWLKLFKTRNGALRVDIRAEKKAKQLALPFGGRQ